MPATKTYNKKPWADSQEAAEILGVTKRTIYTYCREGRLPATKHKGLWRIERAALQPPEHTSA